MQWSSSHKIGLINESEKKIYPVKKSFILDNRFRRWVHNPRKILGRYIKEGMTVLDIGCGPGFFSLDIAGMVGESGQVIACDNQQGMLHKIQAKIHGTELERRITLHQCQGSSLDVVGQVDFVLAFYMVHEVSNKFGFFQDIRSILNKYGHLFVVEPAFHVSTDAFEESIRMAIKIGLMFAGCRHILVQCRRKYHAISM
nr:class I SAM-dependent methyltransferase [uncultured Desulfobulbus sp.]